MISPYSTFLATTSNGLYSYVSIFPETATVEMIKCIIFAYFYRFPPSPQQARWFAERVVLVHSVTNLPITNNEELRFVLKFSFLYAVWVNLMGPYNQRLH